MNILAFEDILAWQEARTLCAQIYKLCQGTHDSGFNSQIQRASVSIMNNIAEGYARNKTDKENTSFVYFLNIAYGSCDETKSMLYLAEDLGYIEPAEAQSLRNDCRSISNKLFALMQYLRNTPKPTNQSAK